MESEDLMTALINQVCDLNKAAEKMRAKYVWDTRPGDLVELFESDAREWARWKRIGAS